MGVKDLFTKPWGWIIIILSKVIGMMKKTKGVVKKSWFMGIFTKVAMAEANWPYNLKIIGIMMILAIPFVTLTFIVGGQENSLGALFLVGAYMLISIKQVKGDSEKGGIVILGYVVDHPVDSGIVIVPAFLGRLEKFTREVIQKELPDEPEKVWTAVDEQGHELPFPPEQKENFKDPIRATFANDDPDEDPLEKEEYKLVPLKGDGKDDPYRVRATVRVTPVFRYRIVDVIRYLKTLVDEEKAMKQLEDKVIATTVNALQVGTYARALNNMESLGKYISDKVVEGLYFDTGEESITINGKKISNKVLSNKVLSKRAPLLREAVARHWGIIILPVQLKPFGASRALNAKVQAIAEGRADGRADMERAQGITAITAATYLGLQKGLEGLSEEEKRTILATETLKQGMKAGTVIVSSGQSGLADLIAQATAINDKVKKGESAT